MNNNSKKNTRNNKLLNLKPDVGLNKGTYNLNVLSISSDDMDDLPYTILALIYGAENIEKSPDKNHKIKHPTPNKYGITEAKQFNCFECDFKCDCQFVFDLYNTNGDCLNLK